MNTSNASLFKALMHEKEKLEEKMIEVKKFTKSFATKKSINDDKRLTTKTNGMLSVKNLQLTKAIAKDQHKSVTKIRNENNISSLVKEMIAEKNIDKKFEFMLMVFNKFIDMEEKYAWILKPITSI